MFEEYSSIYRERERALFAHHGAARATIAIEQGDDVIFSMIQSTPADAWEVTRLLERDPGSPQRSLELAARHIAVDIAGPRGLGTAPEDPWTFWELEAELSSDPHFEVFGEDLARVVRLIKMGAQTGLWGDEEECYQKAYRMAQEAVDRHWPAIHAVAVKLAARGRIEGDEIREIVEGRA